MHASGPCLNGMRRFVAPATRPSAGRPSSGRPATPCSCRRFCASPSLSAKKPAAQPPPPPGPRATLDLRHIRENADLYAANCVRRNYKAMAGYPAQIVDLAAQWQASQRNGRALREEANAVRRQIANPPVAREVEEGEKKAAEQGGRETRNEQDTEPPLAKARRLKQQLAVIEAEETRLTAEMQRLAAALPNLTSDETPDTEHTVLSYINHDDETGAPASAALSTTNPPADAWRSHVHIGRELGLLDLTAAGTASGWGWYYLLGDGARLEQALVQYALAVVHRHGWSLVAPPTLVRSGIAAACGFQPRDQGGEQQTYALEGLPMTLAATAEIPLAALYAERMLDIDGAAPSGAKNAFPRHAAVSRCYRAEAGARGTATKGLYRVHEFTKVELFAWTPPDLDAATEVFDELVDVQTEILSSLGLPCRVLEMPATDLGASAFRKIDIEAFFPGRAAAAATAENSSSASASDAGWGEVTSASICTDYQSRRLATRARIDGGPLTFPWTLNGTALAVPRVLAALLENGWDEETMTVAIPECLRPWMDGQEVLSRP